MNPLLGMVRGMTVAKARFPVLPDRITPHSVDCTKALSSVVQGISCQFLDLDVREVVETPSSQSVCGPGWARLGQVGHIETLSLKIWDWATFDIVDTESIGKSIWNPELRCRAV